MECLMDDGHHGPAAPGEDLCGPCLNYRRRMESLEAN